MRSLLDIGGGGRRRLLGKGKRERHVLGTAEAFLDAIGTMKSEGGPKCGICKCNGPPLLADMSSTNEVGVPALGEVEVGKYLSEKLWRERIGRCEGVLERIELDDPCFCAENGETLFGYFAGDKLANVVDGEETGGGIDDGKVAHWVVFSCHCSGLVCTERMVRDERALRSMSRLQVREVK